MRRPQEKAALVTGAARGPGIAMADRYAAEGARLDLVPGAVGDRPLSVEAAVNTSG
ncbi:hypothetical protein [Puniceibacterium sp. IMCC21224]|uniref:hypothetical protein n=1 Tax=Puniceibacterium sp. IMCC21224 TaxID=1618204 RepID=UPI00065D57FB|nr:hypothetical protein [Puniceibacterium sp. IMCC21224]KMK64882.1 hypothetical protein IMCC21224_12127 [Puniceibacterium sp. IMCC21224]